MLVAECLAGSEEAPAFLAAARQLPEEQWPAWELARGLQRAEAAVAAAKPFGEGQGVDLVIAHCGEPLAYPRRPAELLATGQNSEASPMSF